MLSPERRGGVLTLHHTNAFVANVLLFDPLHSTANSHTHFMAHVISDFAANMCQVADGSLVSV